MVTVKKNSETFKKESEELAKVPKQSYDMLKAIKDDTNYKSNVVKRDKTVRSFLERHFDINMNWKKYIVPGQVIMFDYFKPIHKEELEYYDGLPITIIFGVKKTDQGDRVIGFNIHYYPPTIRYSLMSKIFYLYRDYYLKFWNKKMTTANPRFDYRYVIYNLQKAKLDFGIREYDPTLMRNIRPLTPNVWQKIVFTEGKFFKRTRDAILNYWKQKRIDPKYISKITKTMNKKKK